MYNLNYIISSVSSFYLCNHNATILSDQKNQFTNQQPLSHLDVEQTEHFLQSHLDQASFHIFIFTKRLIN